MYIKLRCDLPVLGYGFFEWCGSGGEGELMKI